MKGSTITLLSALLLGHIFLIGCSQQQPEVKRKSRAIWENDLRSELQALGYRNWIVIADASFPFHNRPGVRTVVAPVETPEVLSALIGAIDEKQHVKPQFYLARELQAVKNRRAPGIIDFRSKLKSSLSGYQPREVDNATLNKLLQATSSSYAVLVVKTQTALPYSSVFVELDSGYWDGEAERELRDNLNSGVTPFIDEKESVATLDS